MESPGWVESVRRSAVATAMRTGLLWEQYGRQLRPIAETLGAAAVAGIASNPLASVVAVSHAEVNNTVGPLPSTIEAAPGYSCVKTSFGTFYADSKKFVRNGVGACVTLNGLPGDTEQMAKGDFGSVVEPAVGLFNKPMVAKKGYAQALEKEIDALRQETNQWVSLMMFGALVAGGLLANRKDLKTRYTQLGVGSLVIVGVGLGGAQQLYETWQNEQEQPAVLYAVEGVEDTVFAGTVANNQMLADAVAQIRPAVERVRARTEASNEQFLAHMHDSVDALVADDSFVAPEEGQTCYLLLPDLHSNQAMIQTYAYLNTMLNEKYGDKTIGTVVLIGDQTYGSAAEAGSIQAMATIAEDKIGILGNHDGPVVATIMKQDGIQLLEGRVARMGSQTILGDADPEITSVTALFGAGQNEQREGYKETQEESGERLRKIAEEDMPTFLITHEAYQAGPIIRVDNVNRTSMDAWFKEKETTPSPIPASVVAWGHWHSKFAYRVVPREDGGYGVVMNLDSAGGVLSEAATLGKISLPWEPPLREASAVYVTIEDESNLAVNIQEIKTSPDGLVRVVHHGSPVPEARALGMHKSTMRNPQSLNTQQ